MERRVAVVGSGKVAQRSLDWCGFWIIFLLHSTNWRWIYFSRSIAAQSSKVNFILFTNPVCLRSARYEISYCYCLRNEPHWCLFPLLQNSRFLGKIAYQRQSGTMDQGLGTTDWGVARPKGQKGAEMQGGFGVIVPRSITGRLEEVDRPRQKYSNGLHNKESLSCSSVQHIIAFYTSATDTLNYRYFPILSLDLSYWYFRIWYG
jgi:hypothetical protein